VFVGCITSTVIGPLVYLVSMCGHRQDNVRVFMMAITNWF